MDRHQKLEVLSNLINSTKKKNLSHKELTMLANSKVLKKGSWNWWIKQKK